MDEPMPEPTSSAQLPTPDEFVAGLSEDQAFSVIHAIRSKFDWVGTEFTPQDVREMLTDEQDGETLTDDQIAAVVDKVVEDYAYRKLADRLAELGNSVLADAVLDAKREVVPDGT